jgi:protein TonB
VITATTAVASTVGHVASAVVRPFTSSPTTKPPPAGLDDYKTQVAQHVVQHNPGHSFKGTLPPLLPAIVVLEITVDSDGRMTDVAVQRSRNPDASEVALASMRRSTPLPRPQQLAQAGGKLTFSETFLFADRERYQLRSLAGPQASE